MSLERLSNDAIDEQSLIALEHRHRYEFAARFCAGLRVVDLCCGVGYGSAILAGAAATVRGIDVDPAAIDEAERAHGALEGVSFDAADAVRWLAHADVGEVDVVVCFEGLEHLGDDRAALDGLERLARSGIRLILSMPNSRRYEEDNPFHVTNFDRDAVDRWARRLNADLVLGQWNAEGTLIAPEAGDEAHLIALEAAPPPSERRPRGWAMHYLVLVNTGEATTAPGADLSWVAEPANARWAQSLHRGNRELWVENARLAAEHTRGTFSAGAAAALVEWRRRAAELEFEEREAALARREREVSRREVALDRQTADLGRRERALYAWELVVKDRERELGLGPDARGSGAARLLEARTAALEEQRRDADRLTETVAQLEHRVAVLSEIRRRRAVRLALGGTALLGRLRGRR